MTPGSKWRHFKGGLYKLLGGCRLEATGEPHVVYKAWEDGDDFGAWWVRPLADWNWVIVQGDGSTVKRFTEVEA